jgi:hypothetical protein
MSGELKCPFCNKELHQKALDRFTCSGGEHILLFTGQGIAERWQTRCLKAEASLTTLRNKVAGLCPYHISEVHSGNLEEAENIIKAIKQELEAGK